MTGLMRLLTYAGVFLLSASLSSSATDARRLLAVIVCSAIVYTLYAFAAGVINQKLTPTIGVAVWVPNEGFFSGTFINSNNYATYAGVAALTAFVLGIPPPHSAPLRDSAAQRWRRRLGLVSGRGGMWTAAGLILVTGVLFSGSRAGWVCLAIAFMAMVVLYTQGVGRLTFGLLALLVFAALALLMPGGENLVNRTAVLMARGESGRENLYPLTLDAIALRPFLGWGMNSFASLYTVFQPISLSDYFDKAHSTYLELAFDLGIPVATMLVLAVLWIVGRCWHGFFTRGRDRELAGLGVFASVMTGLHSLFDFSLQIPGMACIYFTVLGVAWSQSWSSRHERG